MIVVVDTNIFISAVMSQDGASRQVIRLCLQGIVTPLMGNALLAELEDVNARDALFDAKLVSRVSRDELLDAFLASSRWISIYYLWRPNLRDEADNHVLELAIAGNASCIITANKRDFVSSEIKFPSVDILNAAEFLKKGDFSK
jgi:putative PIN family toxin of toxin-antitoxin system